MAEIIDTINDDNEVTGQIDKAEAHKQALAHRVSAVVLFNEDGKLMLPTAAAHKPEAGNLFHSAAGHVHAGEDYIEGALRELLEECGLEVERRSLDFLGSFWFKHDYPTRKERERFELFRVVYHSDMPELKLNDEQHTVAWYSLSELKELLANDPEKLSRPLRTSLQLIFKLSE